MKTTKNVLITFTAPPQQREALRLLSEKTGFSMGEMLRQALTGFIDKAIYEGKDKK